MSPSPKGKRRIPVLIPGFFGSALSNGRRKLWSPSISDSFTNLARDPRVLSWLGQPADAEFIEAFHLLGWRIPIWTRTIQQLRDAAADIAPEADWVRFGYDWRASLLDTAVKLKQALSERVAARTSSPAKGSSRFLFVTHSMGALALRAAIGSRLIDPTWIDRIIHVGAPLRGAPAALRAAFDPEQWPFLPALFSTIRYPFMPSRYRLIQAMQDAARNFESAFELLPPEQIVYANYRFGEALFNPLYEALAVRPEPSLAKAQQAHRVFAEAEAILATSKTRTFSIYSGSRATTAIVQLRPAHLPPSCIIDQSYEAFLGDGSVPMASAEGSAVAQRGRVDGVEHAFLCNDSRVVTRLAAVI